MMDSKILLLNRSAPPSPALIAQVHQCGLRLTHLPLVHASVCAAPDAGLRAHVNQSDWLLFCSPRAVEFAEQLLPEIWQLDAKFGAVGPGTARRIHDRVPQRSVLFPDTGDGARALLARAELASVRGVRISILTGADGLVELESGLRARGAAVQTVPLYERINSALNAEQRELCQRAQCAYVGSVSFLDALLLARNAQPLPVWVPSERVAAHARQLGCPPHLCADSSDGAFITRLKHYRC